MRERNQVPETPQAYNGQQICEEGCSEEKAWRVEDCPYLGDVCEDNNCVVHSAAEAEYDTEQIDHLVTGMGEVLSVLLRKYVLKPCRHFSQCLLCIAQQQRNESAVPGRWRPQVD